MEQLGLSRAVKAYFEAKTTVPLLPWRVPCAPLSEFSMLIVYCLYRSARNYDRNPTSTTITVYLQRCGNAVILNHYKSLYSRLQVKYSVGTKNVCRKLYPRAHAASFR